MAEKQYKGRKAYLNDFKKNESGDYEYRGSLYYRVGEMEKFRRELLCSWLVYGVMMAGLLVAACLDAPGAMNSFYVVFPLAISVVFGFSTGWALFRVSTGGDPLRAYVYEASVEKLPFRTGGVLVCTITTVLGELMYVFRNGFGENAVKILGFLVLEAVICGFSLLFLQRIRQMSWKKETQN